MNVHSMAAGKYPPRGKRPKFPVRVLLVHPLVWADALRRSGYQASRIDIMDSETVIVRNHPWQVKHGFRTR